MLKDLGDYLNIKSLFLLARNDPKVLDSEEFQRKTLAYFKSKTNIHDFKFWNSLSEEQQKRAVRYFALQEVYQSDNLRLGGEHGNDCLFVILHGNVHVKHEEDAEEVTYSTGDVFGNVDYFDQHSKNVNAPPALLSTDDSTSASASEEKRNEEENKVLIRRNRGAYLRMNLSDFKNYILPTPERETKIDYDEFSKIAEIPYHEMTEEDKFFVKVYMHCRKLLRKDFFSYLDAHKLVPKNSRSSAVKCYHTAHTNQEILLKKRDSAKVFILIDGSFRMEIVARRTKQSKSSAETLPVYNDSELERHLSHNKGAHRLLCQKKGEEAMDFKVR